MYVPSRVSNDNSVIDLCTEEHPRYDNILQQFSDCTIYDPSVFPVLIFCDSLKSTDKLFASLEEKRISNQDRKKILLIKNKSTVRAEIMWEVISNGVYDIIDWTSDNDVITYVNSLTERNDKITSIINSPLVKKNLIGESKVWQLFLHQIIEAVLFSKSPILLIGESGTGKELISRLIHSIDTRVDKKDLVLLDCTTIVPELAGSEFFGHEKGSYTNALQAREGAFYLANHGTLFLDEVGELPMNLQAELLRVIQEGTFKKIGSNTWQKTNFRLVSATHKDIKTISTNGSFRQDLYFRISDFEFTLPSLDERKEDIPLLAKYFLEQFFNTTQAPELDDWVITYLMNREYPGNIRDLRQLIRRIAIKHLNHKKITIGEIPVQDRPAVAIAKKLPYELEGSLRNAILSGFTLRDLKNKTMADAIKITLEICKGDKTMAARKLGVTLRAFQQFWKKNKAS